MILVTGATGLSGSAVIRELARHGYPVKALVRNRAKVQAFEAFPTVECVEGNMLQPETLGRALDGVEHALLVSSANEQMVETQCTFIDAAKKAGVRHIVKLSGVTTSLDSPFLFARKQATIEHYLERSGLAWTILRPSQFMVEYLREVPTIISKHAFCLPLEEAKLTPVDLGDVAKAALALLNTQGHEGRIYMMSGPQALSMAEIADEISLAIGKTVHYVSISVEERKQALLAASMPAYVADALDVKTKLRQKGNGEEVVHLETHTALGIRLTALGIRLTPFAEFARRHTADFLGASAFVSNNRPKGALSNKQLVAMTSSSIIS